MTRIGASQVFFNIVAQFNAEKLIKDYDSVNTVMKAVSLDTFEAILKPLEGLGQAINTITDELNPLQEALGLATVEFEKFFGSVPAIETMRDSIIQLGEAYAITGVEALAAGSRAAQVANLLGRGNVETLQTLAFTLAEISDLNAEEAQRGIIQLHQQTGMLFGELDRAAFTRLSLTEQQTVLNIEGAKALDALNTIANRSVALEGDLVRVMGTFAAQGELVGDSFEFMAAASATLLEAGEEQGTAGRALRMMYARLGGDISGARTQIEAMGFSLTDSEGNMKNMQDVLTELSSKGWSSLSGAQKQNIAQTIAGNRHYVRFIKLMENYDRTMQLTTDGAAGFDSALGQANRALQTQVNLLKKAQIANENLRAKIGEGLTPFMLAQVETQNSYLEVTEVLTDSLGGLGKAMGNLKATMGVMGSFIKVGLATQSFGIGLEMFTSVQRQLNGILVANEHLHSKAANYMKEGVKATLTQRDLLAGMQFIQQKINMHAEQRRANEKVLAPILEQQKNIQQRMLALDEHRNVSIEKFFMLSKKVVAAEGLRTATLETQDSQYQRRVARLQYEATFESNMLAETEALYSSKSATQDAMMRQYLADLQVAAQLTDEELLNIEKRHNLLREEHSLMQILKADNEIRYRAQGGNRDGMASPISLLGQGSSAQMSNDERQKLAMAMEQYADQAKASFSRAVGAEGILTPKMMSAHVSRMKASGQDVSGVMGHMTDSINGYGVSMKLMEDNTAAYTAGEAHTFQNAMESHQGQIIQTTKAMETHGMMTQDQITVGRELAAVDRDLLIVEGALTSQHKEMIFLETQDIALMKEMQPLLAKIASHETSEVERNKALLDISRQLHTSKGNLNAQARAALPTNKENLKFAEDTTMAHRQFGFAIQNSVGLLGGMIGGTTGAAMSMAFMSGNLIMAGKGATQAAVKMVTLQFAQTKAAISADRAAWSQQKLNGALSTTTVAARSAAMSLALMIGPYIAIAAAIALIVRHSKAAAEQLDDLNDDAMEFENQMNSISRDKKLLGDNDSLAEAIGLDNMTTGEMLDSGADINDMILTLKGTMGQYTDEQNTQIQNAIDYLQVVKSTNDLAAGTLNPDMFSEAARDARGELDDFYSTAARGALGIGGFDIDAGKELFDEINRYGMDFSNKQKDDWNPFSYLKAEGDAKRNMNMLITYMEDGNKLTQEQLDLAEQYYNDDEISGYLRILNKLVLTEEVRLATQLNLAEAIEATNAVTDSAGDELKNLTAEIYNFSGAREELFFGGKYGNVTGSLYKQVVTQGVGTLYHKNEVIMTTNFHGFFNEKEAADRITRIVTDVLATGTVQLSQ